MGLQEKEMTCSRLRRHHTQSWLQCLMSLKFPLPARQALVLHTHVPSLSLWPALGDPSALGWRYDLNLK